MEAFFYALFPLVLARLARVPGRALVPALIGLVLVGVLLAGAGELRLCDRDPFGVDSPQNWAKFFPPMHLPAFLFGAVLGRLFLERPSPSDRTLALVGWGSVSLLLASAFIPGLHLFKHSGGLMLPHSGLVWALAHERGLSARILAAPLLILLGEASYALYIVHEPLFTCWGRLGLPSIWTIQGRLVFVLAVTVLSVLLYRLYELPARAWIRGRFTRLNPQPVA